MNGLAILCRKCSLARLVKFMPGTNTQIDIALLHDFLVIRAGQFVDPNIVAGVVIRDEHVVVGHILPATVNSCRLVIATRPQRKRRIAQGILKFSKLPIACIKRPDVAPAAPQNHAFAWGVVGHAGSIGPI